MSGGDRERLPFDDPAFLEREERDFWLAQARRSVGDAKPWVARDPCPDCDTTDAFLVARNGQDTVRCAACNRLLYNAPRTETGRRPRTVTTVRQGISAGQQARILDRDQARCVLCGRDDQPLTIGHLLSIDDGVALGASARELNDDANLAAMCEACNLGLNRHSVSPKTYARIMFRLIQAQRRGTGDIGAQLKAPTAGS